MGKKKEKGHKADGLTRLMISTSPIVNSTLGLIISKTIVIRITCLDTKSWTLENALVTPNKYFSGH